MARPTPIIIPGPTGMGGNFKETKASIDLSPLLYLLNKKKEEEQQGEIKNLIAQLASVPLRERPDEEIFSQLKGEGQQFAVNKPTGTGIDPDKFAALQLAQKTAPGQFGQELSQFLFPKQGTPSLEERMFGRLTPEQQQTATEKKFLGPDTAKEVNLPAEIDSFLTTKFGSKYSYGKPQDRAQYVDYIASPEGKQEYTEYLKQIQEAKQQPFNIVIQTEKGLGIIDARNPEAGVKLLKIGKPLPAGELSKTAEFETLKTVTNKIEELFKPEYVGPIAGRAGAAQEKYVGNIPEEQTQFYAYTRDLMDALLRARSGAAINEQEYKRLTSFLPDPNLPSKTFKSRLNRFREELDITIKSREKEFKGGGYGSGNVGTVNQPTGTKTEFNIGGYKVRVKP